MKNILVLIAVSIAVAMVVAECDSQSEDNSSTNNSITDSSSTDDMEADADGLYESARTPMDKAQNVENVLQDAADARKAAMEEASDNN